MSKLKKEQFELEEDLKRIYGTYGNYLDNKKPASNPYQNYMDMATAEYNRGVEQANLNALRDKANANAEYKELQNNINELNKLSGKKDTGLQGDTNINAYNIYRNSLAQADTKANTTKNDLYSYYLSSMQNLQAQKDAYYMSQNEKVGTALGNFAMDTDSSGNITGDSAKAMWDYVNTFYGGEQNIPNEIKAQLNSVNGFNEWLDEYNKTGATTQYDKGITELSRNSLAKIDANGQLVGRNDTNGYDFAVLDTNKSATSSKINADAGANNFRLDFGGETYYVETGPLKTRLSESEGNKVKGLIAKANGRDAVEGDLVYYKNKLYVVASNGTMCLVQARSAPKNKDDYDNLLKAVKDKLGI